MSSARWSRTARTSTSGDSARYPARRTMDARGGTRHVAMTASWSPAGPSTCSTTSATTSSASCGRRRHDEAAAPPGPAPDEAHRCARRWCRGSARYATASRRDRRGWRDRWRHRARRRSPARVAVGEQCQQATLGLGAEAGFVEGDGEREIGVLAGEDGPRPGDAPLRLERGERLEGAGRRVDRGRSVRSRTSSTSPAAARSPDRAIAPSASSTTSGAPWPDQDPASSWSPGPRAQGGQCDRRAPIWPGVGCERFTGEPDRRDGAQGADVVAVLQQRHHDAHQGDRRDDEQVRRDRIAVEGVEREEHEPGETSATEPSQPSTARRTGIRRCRRHRLEQHGAGRFADGVAEHVVGGEQRAHEREEQRCRHRRACRRDRPGRRPGTSRRAARAWPTGSRTRLM